MLVLANTIPTVQILRNLVLRCKVSVCQWLHAFALQNTAALIFTPICTSHVTAAGVSFLTPLQPDASLLLFLRDLLS